MIKILTAKEYFSYGYGRHKEDNITFVFKLNYQQIYTKRRRARSFTQTKDGLIEN